MVSGLTITFGVEHQYSVANMNGEQVVTVMDSTNAIVVYREGSFTGQAKATVLVVSGTSITHGAESTVNSANSFSIAKSLSITTLGPNRVLAATSISSTGTVRVGTRVGTNMTWGTAIGFSAGAGSVVVESLSPTVAILGFLIGAGNVPVQVLTISGDIITFNTTVNLTAPEGDTDIIKLTSTTFVAVYRGAAASGRAQIGTVSGTTITLSAFTIWNTTDTLINTAARLTDTSFLLAGEVLNAGGLSGTMRARVGTLDTSAGLTGTSALYPTAVGATRVTLAMWARNITGGTSIVTIDRSYSVAMTATSISLGGTTAVWSGTGITTLMGTATGQMNDDSSHLLVLDFVNTGGTNWTLNTSVDGAAFTDQGTQTSGVQAVTTVDTNPGASIASGVGASQWIDELVMWAGNKSTFNAFTTQEMANLNDLANVFGATMNLFQENFGAPLCWQATAMMPDGSPWRDSGSGACPPVIRVPKGADDIVITDAGVQAYPRIIEG